MSESQYPSARQPRASRALVAKAGLLAAWLLLLPQNVIAQAPPTSSNRSKASALFQHAIELMEKKNYETACPELEESYFLSKLHGTLFTLAECHAQAGHVASAFVRYGDFLELTNKLSEPEMIRQRPRRDQATAQRKALEALIPRLTLTLTLPAGVSLDQVAIKQNGRPVLASTLGVALPTDPGKYRITTQVEGGPESEKIIEIAPGQNAAAELPVLPAENKPAPSPASAPPAPRPPPPPLRTAAYAVGGSGLLVLGAGVVAGLLSFGPSAEANKGCRGDVCTPEGIDASNRAQALKITSLIGLAVGGAATGAGVYLYLYPPGVSRGLAASPASGQLFVGGVW